MLQMTIKITKFNWRDRKNLFTSCLPKNLGTMMRNFAMMFKNKNNMKNPRLNRTKMRKTDKNPQFQEEGQPTKRN